MSSKGTPVRAIRIPDAIWEPAKAKAGECGEKLAEIIRKALEEYAAEDD